MVGLCFAQSMAWALSIPFVPINHIEAHMFSPFIDGGFAKDGGLTEEDPTRGVPEEPFISLTVSGGHTLLSIIGTDLSRRIIGQTLDDAAGEAFDKTGKMLGLSYPAGPEIDRLAKQGDPSFHRFPRALTSQSQTSRSYRNNEDFSFSGLKTSVRTWLQKQSPEYIDAHRADIAASIQDAIVSVLVEKTVGAARRRQVNSIAIAGGVSANSALRAAMKKECSRHGIRLHLPSPVYSTDNAAMIAALGELKISRGMRPERRYSTAPFAGMPTGESKA